MTKITIDLIRPHATQLDLINCEARFVIAACGRRWGKTEAGKIVILKRALFQAQRCWWLAPTVKSAEGVWKSLKDTIRHVPHKLSETNQEIDFFNGGHIGVRSTHAYDNLRGTGLDFAVFDEAAYMPVEAWTSIVRPMLLTSKGGALFLSTPRGMNWFYSLYGRGLSKPNWKSFRFPTSSNPLIDPAEIEEMRNELPQEIFEEEALAEFKQGGGAVFRNVDTRAILNLAKQKPDPARQYVFGVDWGRDKDFTVIVVLDDLGNVVAYERFNQIGYNIQRARLMKTYERWKPYMVYAESNSIGTVNIEQLQLEGVPVLPVAVTAVSKPAIIHGLAVAFERDEISIPANDALFMGEFLSYQVERTTAGQYKYTAPSGLHDDIVIATALAWRGLTSGRFVADFA